MNDHYTTLYDTFGWWIPGRFSLAQACCYRWVENAADAQRIALYAVDPEGRLDTWSYDRLARTVSRLANGLTRMGIVRGDRVALVLGQRPESLAALLAVNSVGAIAVPLSCQLGPDALEQRLRHAEARLAIIDSEGGENLLRIQHRCPSLSLILAIDMINEHVMSWRTLLARQEEHFTPLPMLPSDPALLLYPQGPAAGRRPRGLLYAQVSLIGSLPGFVAAHDWFPQPGDVLWTQSDWSLGTTLLNTLLPVLYFGRSLAATAGRLTAWRLQALLDQLPLTCLSFPAAAFEHLRETWAGMEIRPAHLRNLVVTGRTPPSGLSAHCQTLFGIPANFVYQHPSEAVSLIGESASQWPSRPGSLGRAYPGHRIRLAHPDPAMAGNSSNTGTLEISRTDRYGHPDPALALGYWRDPTLTLHQPIAPWLSSEEWLHMDEAGYLWPAADNTPSVPT
ncbi:AMP-binding protein [Corticimicrobacter populi]|uniref:Acetyl-CoA synthetase n=1 Tax=Corticimicrobacter populi TaxID=2175229 RepID=A0A2V1K0Y7_9BURK|nr:AMP-binding protein [Corticimicrobacter populi]PWF22688.1 acetyl-CoA synthetase [Corticimicrobacter populi]